MKQLTSTLFFCSYIFFFSCIGLTLNAQSLAVDFLTASGNLPTSPDTLEAVTTQVVGQIDLTNLSSSTTHNDVFIYAFSNSGELPIDSINLIDSGGGETPLINNNHIYQVGLLSPSETQNFHIYVGANACTIEDIEIFVGSDCGGYPNMLLDYNCSLVEKMLWIHPQSPAFFMPYNQMVSETDLCTEEQFEVTISNNELGHIYDLTTQIKLPENVVLVPNSLELNYTSGVQPIADSDIVVLSGNVYEINLSEQDPMLLQEGLHGTYNTPLHTLNFAFKVQANCGYLSGSQINVTSFGKSACGADVSISASSVPMTITGVSVPNYATDITISSQFIDGCMDEITLISVMVQNMGNPNDAGDMPTTGNQDSIKVQIPEGFEFTGFYMPLTNAISNLPDERTIDGLDYLFWKIQPGIATFDNIEFQFELAVDSNTLNCGDPSFIPVETYVVGIGSCVGPNCMIGLLTGSGEGAVLADKAELSVNTANVFAFSQAPLDASLLIDFFIENTGATVPIGQVTTIHYYSDSNQDYIFTAADNYLGSTEITDEIPNGSSFYVVESSLVIPAGSSCGIFVVIDTAENCVCNTNMFAVQDIPFYHEYIGNTLEHETCSNQPVQIGTEPLSTLNYEWTALSGSPAPSSVLSDVNIPNPDFLAGNNGVVDVLYEYVLRAQRGNCYTYD
ncbi:MAG: hypothetical protein ACPGXL_05290, partial [Chitinophagales bacterium]